MKKEKRKYSCIGSVVWALRRLWRIDNRFVVYIFSAVPFIIIVPLATTYFSKILLEALGRGASFPELAGIVAGTIGGIALLDVLRAFLNTLPCQTLLSDMRIPDRDVRIYK